MNKTKIFVGSFVLSLWLILCVGWVIVQYFYPDNERNLDEHLIFAQTICRHGEVNQDEPWNSEESFVELTKVGKRQHYTLGKYLRQRYSELLKNEDYSPNEVYIQATDVDHVLMSAQVALAGMFPPQSTQRWKENLIWQPIPVHNIPTDQDNLLSQSSTCKRMDYELNKYFNSTEHENLLDEHKTLIQYLEVNSGRNLKTLADLNHLYDRLSLEQQKGYPLPLWAQETMKPGSDFEYLALFYYTILTHSIQTTKLSSGFLLKDILCRFKEKIQSSLSPDRAIWMYFAQDFTISNILNSFGLSELHRPRTASCLFLELYKTESDNFIQVFYRNSTESNVLALEIPNRAGKCSLDQFYELYEHILPTQSFKDECEVEIKPSQMS